jgi:hypothetical protein
MDDKIEYVDIYKEPRYKDVTLDEAIELLQEYKNDGVRGGTIIGKKFDRTNECNHTEKTPEGYKYKEVSEYRINIITKEYTCDDAE